MSKQLNFAQQMDEVLKTLGPQRPKLLLHACCGPCSSAVLEKLCSCRCGPSYRQHLACRRILPPGRGAEKVRGAGAPAGGHGHRRTTTTRRSSIRLCRGWKTSRSGAGHTVCYRLRMRRAAPCAKEHGFDWFTTTLSISPHKDAARINQIGQELEAEFGIGHLPSDFKKQNGYLRSLQLSEEYGLYRQDYCGCEFSAKARG